MLLYHLGKLCLRHKADRYVEKGVVLNEGEQYLTRLLQPDEGLKYILVIPNENMIPYIELPDAPCMFAVIQSVPGAAPEVTFYSKGA